MNKKEKFIYENELGQHIEFSIWSPFFIQNIDGISGLKNIIYTNKGMGQDGTTYTGSTLDNRNIVIQGSIIENKEFNRKKLLSTVNPKLKSKLIWDNGENKYYVECKVENAPIITKDNKPKFQISLLCPNPYWKNYIDSKVNIASWQGSFEFPLEISENEEIEFGYRNEELLMNIQNNGDVTCGMTVEFRALGTVVNPSILNVITREFIKINKTMSPGEIIRVNTNFGSKRVEQEINTELKNISQFINLDSTYMQLDVGDNYIKYNADSNVGNLEVTISYSQQYLGV
ncbi:phage tail family protein [Clostridium sp. Marseille-Q7071]